VGTAAAASTRICAMFATGAAGLTRQFAVCLAFKSAFQPAGETELDSRLGLG